MKPELKVLKHYVKGLTMLTFEERKDIVNKLIKKKSLTSLAKEMNIPKTTLHGWKTGRNLYRSNQVVTELKEIGDLNRKLNTILEILDSINKIDNDISREKWKKVKEEIKRIEE